MSEPTKIESHYEEAKDLLPSQFYDKPYINAHLQALADQCQEVEDLFYDDIYTDKMFVNATGTNLEEIGELYNVRRVLGESDETLRRNIGAEILRRNSEGTQGSVKSILSAFTGLTNMRVFEHSVGCPIIFGETLDESYELSGDEAQYIKDAAPITTGSCVFGVSYSSEYSNTIIPAELDLTYYNLVVDGDCRYYFNFAGDGYISSPKRWYPDAVDPSFVIEFRNDLSIEGFTISQSGGFASSEEDIRIVSTSLGCFLSLAGGSQVQVVEDVDLEDALWRFEFNGSEVTTYKNENYLQTSSITTGSNVVTDSTMQFMTRYDSSSGKDSGILSDVRLWVNGSTTDTGTLVLDMPIGDNSTSIKDYAPSESGVLDAGSGEWIAVEGSGYQFDFNGDGFIDIADINITGYFEINFKVSIPVSATVSAKIFDASTASDGLDVNWNISSGGLIDTRSYFRVFVDDVETYLLPNDGVEHSVQLIRDSTEVDQDSKNLERIGSSYDYTTPFVGKIYDITIEEEGVLTLDMPINDNSNAIVNYADRVSGTLVEGTGYWEEICESEEKNLVTGSISESKNIVVRKASDTLTESSADSQNAQLAEFTVTTAQMSVDLEDGSSDILSLNSDGNYLKVSYEGIENDRGVPLNTTQITIDSSVADIQAAFNEVAP